jgi:hypothetical protein
MADVAIRATRHQGMALLSRVTTVSVRFLPRW